jgi:cytochrome c-type biogenesis protein CcmH
MLLWVALALMTAAAAMAALWPLARDDAPAGAVASDVAVYKDQLAEIGRDQDRGMIGAAEAEAARIEVSRRLIEADAAARSAAGDMVASPIRRRVAAFAIIILVPAVGLGLYWRLGSPSLPDQPLETRLAASPDTASLEQLVVTVETHLARSPDDGEGWQALAPIYLRAGRSSEAKLAYANALRLLGSTPEREADFGEAAAQAAGGVVTAEAKAAFVRALAADPSSAKARYFLGLAKEQDGDKAGAVAEWNAIAAAQPADSPVAAFMRREIARVEAPPAPGRGPTPGDVAAAGGMAAPDRARMIEGMVEGLAIRLRQQGGGIDDWLKLVRAYSVLGQKEKAIMAAADARKALAASPDEVQAVDALVKSLGLEG